jgi:hypothetical protein
MGAGTATLDKGARPSPPPPSPPVAPLDEGAVGGVVGDVGGGGVVVATGNVVSAGDGVGGAVGLLVAVTASAPAAGDAGGGASVALLVEIGATPAAGGVGSDVGLVSELVTAVVASGPVSGRPELRPVAPDPQAPRKLATSTVATSATARGGRLGVLPKFDCDCIGRLVRFRASDLSFGSTTRSRRPQPHPPPLASASRHAGVPLRRTP